MKWFRMNVVFIVGLAAIAMLTLTACAGSGVQTLTPTPPTIVTPVATTTPRVVETATIAATPVADTTPLPKQRPGDFSVTYQWRAGSMPPPFHYEYTVIIGPGTEGKVIYRPDYASQGVPTWTETFPVTVEQLDKLYALVLDDEIFTRKWERMEVFPVGGSYFWADVTAAGREVDIPDFPASPNEGAAGELFDAVTAFVPQATWNKLEAQRKEYVENFDKTPTPTPTPTP